MSGLDSAEALARRFAEGDSESVLASLQRLAPRHLPSAVRHRTDARWVLALAPLRSTGGREAGALARLDAVAAWSRDAAEPELELAAWCAMARVRLRRGDFGAVAVDAPRVERLLVRTSALHEHVLARVALAHALAWTDREHEAEAHLREAQGIADEEGYRFGSALALAHRAFGAAHSGRTTEARDMADEATIRARVSGKRRAFALAHWARGWQRAAEDDLDEAAVSLELAARTQHALAEWAPAASTWARRIELDGWRGRSNPSVLRMAALAARKASSSAPAVEVLTASIRHHRAMGSPREDVQRQRLVALAADESDGRALQALKELEGDEPGGFQRELATMRAVPERPFRVAADGSGFRGPMGDAVDLGRRGRLMAVLRLLSRARRSQPGCPVPASDLLEAAWGANAPSRNVHTAAWTLRRLGLADALQTVGDGYRLDPRLTQVEDRDDPVKP